MGKRGNGEGTIKQRADGRWEAQYLHDGKRKSLYAATRMAVAAKLAIALKAREDGLPVTDDRQTTGAFLASWLERAKVSLDPSTSRRYESLLRVHVLPALGRVALTKLAPQQLQSFYAARLAAGCAPRSVRHMHAVLRCALGQARRWGLVPRNVAELVDAPAAPQREIVTLDEGQYRRFLAAIAGDRFENLYIVAVTTGMREGELLGLRWCDVDLENGWVQVRQSVSWTTGKWRFKEPKTAKSRRRIELTKDALAALRRQKVRQAEERLRAGEAWQDLDLVFANEVGGPMDGSNLLERYFYPLLRRAGLPRMRIHDLRHTCATILLGRGVHPKIVSEMLGHSTAAITLDLYSHVTPTMQREAVAVFDAIRGAAGR